LLTGNRGCLHNDKGRIVRDFQVTRWIICLLEFRGRKRALMQPGHYTELFFLDEATALAAGHRPCAECQRTRYDLFRKLWATAHNSPTRPRAGEMDALLHTARWVNGTRHTYVARLDSLPSGTIVTVPESDTPLLVAVGQLWQWSFAGYTHGPHLAADAPLRVLTPQPTVRVLTAGYPVNIHPSLWSLAGN
jgi:hypothetical protein